MPKYELIKSCSNLLDIFHTESDEMGVDILEMSDFFNIFVSNTIAKIGKDDFWVKYNDLTNLMGEISIAIQSGLDISNMGTLIADSSHFSKEIIEGLKSGIYHIGESKEVSGNYRPAILDENEHLVKFFTLKKANNPTKILSDISTISMQRSLRQISAQLEEISSSIESLTNFERRQKMCVPFINAREKMIEASESNNSEDIKTLLNDAQNYLMEGLNSLYTDLNEQIKELSNVKATTRIKTVNSILTRINEDMQMIPRYVGLRIYIFTYLGKNNLANRVLENYEFQIKSLNQKNYGKKQDVSAAELIHSYYKYNDQNLDFWLNMPKKFSDSLDSYKEALENNSTKDVYFIEMEEEFVNE